MTETMTQTKSVFIVSSRPPKTTRVDISAHDTAADVLEKADLDPTDMLMRPGDQADFSPTDLPYEEVPDGGKLHVVPASTVGSNR